MAAHRRLVPRPHRESPPAHLVLFSFGSTRAISWMVAMMQIGEAVSKDAAPRWL
jgi:hypothetical protein